MAAGCSDAGAGSVSTGAGPGAWSGVETGLDGAGRAGVAGRPVVVAPRGSGWVSCDSGAGTGTGAVAAGALRGAAC